MFHDLRSFILDVPHGLSHSLDILEDLLEVDERTFRDSEERRYAKEVHIGAALFHDLTSLRDRHRHHETARDLARDILCQLKNADGSERYTPRLINDIAMTCLNHRGQTFPEPTTQIQRIFMEVDEYNLVKNMQRIMDQPANGFFQPEYLDVFRDISFQELPHTFDRSPVRHETAASDYFEYLGMTLFIRTDPRKYSNPVVKKWVKDSYPVIRDQVLRTGHTMIYNEVMWGRKRNSILLMQVKQRIYRFKGIVRELEVLYRGRYDSYAKVAKARIRKEAGTPRRPHEAHPRPAASHAKRIRTSSVSGDGRQCTISLTISG